MIRSNGSTVIELLDTTSGIPLVLAHSVKIRPGGNLEVTLECTRKLTNQMDIRIDVGFHHRCLHCAGDHESWDCTMKRQHHAPMTNNPASGTGTSTHYHAPNSPSCISSQSNTQSPTDYQHSQSTIHVQTPTLMVNGPQFQLNLQQPPPAPVVQTNQPTNYHT